jgi:hypothetical protein
MDPNDPTAGEPPSPPAGPQPGGGPPPDGAEPQAPEPAPTDFGRNIWLLVIILVVVAVAWLLSLRAGTSAVAAGAAPPSPQTQGPSAGPPEIPPAAPVLAYQVVGSDRSYVLASEALTLRPGALPYRLPRLFDVTQRAPGFQVQRLARLAGDAMDQLAPFRASEGAGGTSAAAASAPAPGAEDRLVVIGEAGSLRAYPVAALSGRLGVYDTVEGRPVLVCWDDLCQDARCLVAASGGEPVEWKDAGLVYRAARLFYDGGGSLWDSFSGLCLTGPRSGQSAQVVPAAVWPWQEWRDQHPDAPVTAPAGVRQPLRRPRSAQYLEAVRARLAAENGGSGPLKPEAFVIGVAAGGQARAYPLAALYGTAPRRAADHVGGLAVEVQATSDRTGYATSEGRLIDAPVMLWFAWRMVHPESDVYSAPAQPAGLPAAQ